MFHTHTPHTHTPHTHTHTHTYVHTCTYIPVCLSYTHIFHLLFLTQVCFPDIEIDERIAIYVELVSTGAKGEGGG